MGHRLFVGNLSFETSDGDLKVAFSKAGVCESAQIVKDRLTGKSRGFGFVEMASADDAQRAVATLNGTELNGRSMNVSEARERSAARSGPRPGPSGGGFGYRPDPSPTPHFRKEGGSRRGVRARKRSL